MSDKILIGTIAAGLFCCHFLFPGCVKKNYSALDARESADWVKDAVIYRVNLHSFSREGTFNALEKRIPDLKKIGATVVSLMPIHPVGELNRRGSIGNPYAVRDFYEINPAFGTPGDFKSLVNSLHRQGLKIVIDLPAAYAAWDSRLLMEQPDLFLHDKEGAIVSPEIELSDAAQLDYNQHELKKYMIAVMKYWVNEYDIDGFRCVAAESIPADFWNIARKELDRIKPVMMISESSKPEYHAGAFDLTGSWNIYNIFSSIRNQTTFASALDDSLKLESLRFPKGSLHLRFDEIKNETGSGQIFEKFSPQEAKIIAVLKFTIPGVPLIYNGEEAGNIKYLSPYDKVEIDWSDGEDFTELFERLCAIRRGHPSLRNGYYSSISNSEYKTVYSFLRSSGGDSIITVINFGNEKKVVKLKMTLGSRLEWKDQFSGKCYQVEHLLLKLTLLPSGCLILTPQYERAII